MGKRKGRDDMAAKSANLYARIEPDVKEQAEEILATLGIPASNAINMFYKQIILNRGLPFEVKIPTARPVDISRMNAETLDMELEKGYADMQAGRTKSAAQVFTDIRRDYNVSNMMLPLRSRLRMQPDSLTGSKKKSFPWESIRRSSDNMKESPGRVEIHELCLLIIMLFSISPIRQRNWLQ